MSLERPPVLADAAKSDLDLVGYAQSPGRSHVAIGFAEIIFRVDYLQEWKLIRQKYIGRLLHIISPVRHNFADFLR